MSLPAAMFKPKTWTCLKGRKLVQCGHRKPPTLPRLYRPIQTVCWTFALDMWRPTYLFKGLKSVSIASPNRCKSAFVSGHFQGRNSRFACTHPCLKYRYDRMTSETLPLAKAPSSLIKDVSRTLCKSVSDKGCLTYNSKSMRWDVAHGCNEVKEKRAGGDTLGSIQSYCSFHRGANFKERKQSDDVRGDSDTGIHSHDSKGKLPNTNTEHTHGHPLLLVNFLMYDCF